MDEPRIDLIIEPTVGGVVRYLALAPSTPNGGERFQLSFEARFINLEPNPVRVTLLRVSFPDAPGLGADIAIKTLLSFDPFIVMHGLRLGAAGTADDSRAPKDFPETDNIVLTSTPPQTIKFEVEVEGFDDLASFTFALGRHESPVAGDAYVWMGKAHDLRRGECWQGIGAAHCCGHQLYAHDFGVVAFDESINSWNSLLPNGDVTKNEDYRIWDKAVYAMADGTVVGFDNTISENTSTPNLPVNPPSAFGNHFVLRHGTDLMVYAHLQSASMNAALMPSGLTGAAVRAGEFLGRVGNTGNSSWPHLHIHCIDEASNTLRPIPWQQKMVARREEKSRPAWNDWHLSRRQGLAVVNTLIYPGDAMPADGREWSEWNSLGGELLFGPAACSWAENRLDVFAVGIDRALWHKWWDGSRWHDWVSLGGELTAKPAAVSWGRNRIDVFGRATDNSLYHKWWDGSRWHDWHGLGGTLLSAPAVSSRRENRLDVFGVATDRSLHHLRWNGSKWTDWSGLGGTLTADPAAVSWDDDRIDVFGRATDETLYQKWWDGSSWGDWEPRARRMTFGPAVSSRRANRLDVFLVAPDGTLQHVIWNGSGRTIWESLGGFLTADPAAVSWSSRRIDVFARGADNACYHTYWEPS